ncbi:hypothetical protein Patl1_35291 [Pistacia atlantica]|nr:hypothetical protein Patl1_35291 [Pistacia atlantica]
MHFSSCLLVITHPSINSSALLTTNPYSPSIADKVRTGVSSHGQPMFRPWKKGILIPAVDLMYYQILQFCLVSSRLMLERLGENHVP